MSRMWFAVAFITVRFSIPPNELAGWSIVLLSAFMALYGMFSARHSFRVPRRHVEDAP